MFARYPPPSRRVIFYAREAALNAGAVAIDSSHLLAGLILEVAGRETDWYKLGERFPEETARLRKMPRAAPKDIPLARDARRVLALAEVEANQLDCYWIDTDVLMLGMLRERDCDAVAKLQAAGLDIAEIRRHVSSYAGKQEDYGPIPALWRWWKPVTRGGRMAGMMYLLFVFVLIKFLTGRGC